MPYTIVCFHDRDGHMGRAPLHWDDRADAVNEMSRQVEQLAHELGFSDKHQQEAVTDAIKTGRFLVLGYVRWAVAEIDRPDQPVIEFAEKAVQLLTGDGVNIPDPGTGNVGV
ncbi:hypothetical protein [Actinomadura litoris]|uniref:hypothetical protein n=1 Tax=Actinomadura litoris TaxID=2678616 RepID=UPI001FA6E4A8|nr:hypothetical protein [Actinomadura litoris]